MPTLDAHVKQSRHNQKLLSFFNSQKEQKQFSDWYLTISFYCAVHLVEAILYKSNEEYSWTFPGQDRARILFNWKHSEDAVADKTCSSEHVFRNLLLKRNRLFFGEMYTPYGNLYERSRMARYNCYLDKVHDFDKADSWLEAVKREYALIIKRLDQPPVTKKTKL